MTKTTPARTSRTRKTTKSVKATKKRISKSRIAFLSRFIPKSKKGIIRLAIAVVTIIAVAGAIPLPYAFAKSSAVDFATKSEDYAGLEMGDSKVLQEGRAGKKVVTIESLQSLWGRLFGLQPIQQTAKSETITESVVEKIVANGTRKYQYMMCSDGRYRYYTDEQFKDPRTGFTSKSSDNCKENNQGVKVKLADSPDGSVISQAASNSIANTPTPAGCKKTSVPFKTEYQNASYLPKGTQQIASQGMNGFTLSCPGSSDITSSGVNQLVLVGTGKTAAEIQAEKDTQEVSNQQAEDARTQRYYINFANCVQNLKAQGMQPSAAESHCRSIITR